MSLHNGSTLAWSSSSSMWFYIILQRNGCRNLTYPPKIPKQGHYPTMLPLMALRLCAAASATRSWRAGIAENCPQQGTGTRGETRYPSGSLSFLYFQWDGGGLLPRYGGSGPVAAGRSRASSHAPIVGRLRPSAAAPPPLLRAPPPRPARRPCAVPVERRRREGREFHMMCAGEKWGGERKER